MSFTQLHTLDATLAELDRLQERVRVLRDQYPDAYERFIKSWSVSSSYNSNAIEGSTMSLGDTALVFEGVEDVDATSEEIAQAKGAKAALDYVLSCVAKNLTLSESIVLKTHKLMYEDAKDPATRGCYRTVEVEITGTDFDLCPAQYIPERMASLLSSVAASKRHPAIVAALFHLEFESIHPFINANGRTGRILSNYILMEHDYVPVDIHATGRKDYIQAIRAFQLNDDPYPFVVLFVGALEDNIKKVLSLLDPIKGNSTGSLYSKTTDYLQGIDIQARLRE